MEHELLTFEREIAGIKSEQSAQKEQLRTVFTRLDQQDKVLDAVTDLALSVRDLSNAQANTSEKVTNLCNDMEIIKTKPAKRWEAILDKIIMTVLGALVMFVLAKLGLV